MLTAFERKNNNGEKRCGYYDSVATDDNKHGGPDPNPHTRPGGAPRVRRSESDDYEGEDGSLLRYDKNDPIRGIKQITTGYRKWAERYISACSNQRTKFTMVS